jgi:prepilin-type processing-associated H-X9-DG protein
MTINTPNSGSDQTLCVDTERPAPCINNQKTVQIAARSKHQGGINATMCDGSVRFIANSIDANLWKALSTMAGQEAARP